MHFLWWINFTNYSFLPEGISIFVPLGKFCKFFKIVKFIGIKLFTIFPYCLFNTWKIYTGILLKFMMEVKASSLSSFLITSFIDFSKDKVLFLLTFLYCFCNYNFICFWLYFLLLVLRHIYSFFFLRYISSHQFETLTLS